MNEPTAPPDPSADKASLPWTPSSRRSVARAGVMALLLDAVAIASFAAAPTVTPVAASAASTASTASTAPVAASTSRRAQDYWGAIAARPDGYGYAFNQPSRAAAEQVARARCERPAGRPSIPGATGMSSPSSIGGRPAGATGAIGACEVRVWFERGCGALATGNFGEWGAAVGADKTAATKAAVTQCDAHLPTEPCRAVVGVCSGP